MEQLAVYRHNKYKILVFAIFTVIYVLPLIYFDVFSLLPLISVIAISMFPFTKKIEKEHTNNKMYIYIAVISILTIFVIMYLYINGIFFCIF